MEDIRFYGWDTLRYYWFVMQNHFVGWSWQISVAYTIVCCCIIALLILGLVFSFRVYRRNRHLKHQARVDEKYSDTFRQILMSDTMSASSMLELLKRCDNEDEDGVKEEAEYFIPILVSIRTDLTELAYFPNLQMLATVSGVREYCEKSLLENHDVFNTLQMMAMLQLVVSEGRLANYVNHRDYDTRLMARLCFIVCGINDPYKFLMDDIEENSSSMYTMMLHYIFAWMKAQNKKMPNFITLANNLKNQDAASFMINEVGYFGTDEEKSEIPTFLTSKSYKCRESAIKSVHLVNSEATYDRLMKMYPEQIEETKREIIKALSVPKNNKYNEFFKEAYENSPSKDTKEIALKCLYDNNKEGRYQFVLLQQKTTDPELATLMQKIDSIGALQMIYELH
ncbi:MAG: hypothetical protein K5984_00055 [Bacteroidales bacterium]|nr:hypothetical protein [Bacteroidales bacterium]